VDRSDVSRAVSFAATLDRRQFLRGIAVTGALAGAGGLLTACSSSSSSTPAPASRAVRRGGSLKVGLTGGSGADTVDPHKGLTYLDSSRLQSLYSPLVQLDANAQLEYMLAESITPSNKTFTARGPSTGPRLARWPPAAA
jgi:peptide/nickel transport system substrate-binding protein